MNEKRLNVCQAPTTALRNGFPAALQEFNLTVVAQTEVT
jgi:hypothetical protein